MRHKENETPGLGNPNDIDTEMSRRISLTEVTGNQRDLRRRRILKPKHRCDVDRVQAA